MAQVSAANPMLPPLPATPTSPSSISTRGGLVSHHHIPGPITRQQQRQLKQQQYQQQQQQQQQQQYHHNSASIASSLSSATSSTSIASRVSTSHQFKTATPPGSPAVPNFSASRKLYRDPPTLPPLPSSSPILADSASNTTTTNSNTTVPTLSTCSPLSIESLPATPLTASSVSSISNSSINTSTATTIVFPGCNSGSNSSSSGGGGTPHVTTPLRLKFESALANSPTYQPAQHRYRRLSASAPIKEPQLRPAGQIEITPSVSKVPSSSRNYKSLAISTHTTTTGPPSTRQTSTASTTSIISTASSNSTANSSICEVTVPPLPFSHISQMDVRQTPPLSIKKTSNASTPVSSTAPTPQGTSPLQSHSTVPKLLTLSKALSNANGIPLLSNLAVGPAKYFEESDVQRRLELLVQSPEQFWEVVDLGFPTNLKDGQMPAAESATDNGVFDDSPDEEQDFSNSTVEEHLPSWHRSMSQGTSNSNEGSSGNIFRKAQPDKYRVSGRSRPDYSLQTLSVEREMTLKFTLTPSTMRADETLIYGWQKEYVESGTLKNYKRTLEEDTDATEDPHNTGSAGDAAVTNNQQNTGFIPSRGLGDNGGKVKGLFSRLRKPKETKNAYMITSSDV